jgi:hypothetical protein
MQCIQLGFTFIGSRDTLARTITVSLAMRDLDTKDQLVNERYNPMVPDDCNHAPKTAAVAMHEVSINSKLVCFVNRSASK